MKLLTSLCSGASPEGRHQVPQRPQEGLQEGPQGDLPQGSGPGAEEGQEGDL